MKTRIQLRNNHTTNVRIFDATAALDETISEMSRGLLYRIYALNYLHLETYGSLNLTMESLADGSPDGIEAIRACFRELTDHDYIRRWKENDEWIIELSVVAEPEKSDIPILDSPPPKPVKASAKKKQSSRPRKQRTESTAPATPRLSVHPGYRTALVNWLQAPEGGDYVVTGKEWSRIMLSINTILEVALARGWVEHGNKRDDLFDDQVDAEQLLTYVHACWIWIKEGAPYRGNLDIHNVAKRIQEWWKIEGERQFRTQQGGDAYTPMMI
jgi:hypothetical protein